MLQKALSYCIVTFSGDGCYENKKEKELQKVFLPINKTSHFSSFSVISYFLSINSCFTQPIGSFFTEI